MVEASGGIIFDPKNYIADWIEDNGLEENKFLSLLFTYKWEWKLDGLPIILKTADCPGCGRLGPVSLPSLNAQWPRVALVSNNMIAYFMHNIFFVIRPCAWNAHPAPQAPNRLTM